jgi:hypothetical protein
VNLGNLDANTQSHLPDILSNFEHINCDLSSTEIIIISKCQIIITSWGSGAYSTPYDNTQKTQDVVRMSFG